MTVELRPLGVKCNIQCQYCYQNPQRDAGNVLHSYDLEKMKAAIETEGRPFSLFGGEPLLVPEQDIEELWSWGFQKYGKNSIQTNGALINDNHIRMFRQYKVDVGISVDGPDELNDVRWAGTLERTREATAKTHAAIERLCREGLPPSLIVTLHRCNATQNKLPVMHNWFRHVESIGITSARLHILEVEDGSIQAKYALTTEENIEAFFSFLKLEKELTTLKFDVFQDMRNLLLGQDNATTCVWNACDPYTTPAVRGVEGNGQRSNCGRTNKDGIDFTKASTEGLERYLALYHTPQTYGGCRDCRFFLMCKGQCPGTAIEGDWRNRTRDCEVWKKLYGYLEEEMISQGLISISIRSDRKHIEQIFLDTWMKGRHTTIASVLQRRNQAQSGARNLMETPMAVTLTKPEETHAHQANHMCEVKGLIERLGFVLPDFTRLSWVSDKARNVWEPRLNRITKAWSEIEWLSVVSGLRSCCITTASPEDFVTRAGEWVTHGLSALPLQIQGVSNYIYSSTGMRAELGKPFVFRFALGKPREVANFKSAFDAGDDQAIGKLLGYPPCCIEFFRETWVAQQLVDTTWPMAVGTITPADGITTLVVNGPPEGNILWRWMGIRTVPHLPCRFDCSDSVELGTKLLKLGRETGYDAEMDWVLEILSWPTEWSALHGIAEIKTPILKVSTRTDATPRKYTVRRTGDGFPLEGAVGLDFPYRKAERPLLTQSRAFKRGLNNPIVSLTRHQAWYASDNGFCSIIAMDNAHRPIVELATVLLSDKGGNILDLGCGNGVLLQKIHAAGTKAVPFGIEFDSSRLMHAREINPQFADNFTLGEMFETDLIWPEERRYALALLMPGRLLEAGNIRAEKLKDRLKNYCDNVLLYSYADWVTSGGNLQSIARQAGFSLLSTETTLTASLATIK